MRTPACALRTHMPRRRSAPRCYIRLQSASPMVAGVRHARLHGARDAGRRPRVRGQGRRVVRGRARVHAALGQPPLPRPVAVRHRGAHQDGAAPLRPGGGGSPRGVLRGARLCQGAARAAAWRTALGQGGAWPPVAPPAAQQCRRAAPRRGGARKGQGTRRDRCSSRAKKYPSGHSPLRRPTRPPSATLWAREERPCRLDAEDRALRGLPNVADFARR